MKIHYNTTSREMIQSNAFDGERKRLPLFREIVTGYEDSTNEHYVSKGYYRPTACDSRSTCLLTIRHQIILLIGPESVLTREASLTRYGRGKKLNTL